jgi:20S proteasome subunit beta 3
MRYNGGSIMAMAGKDAVVVAMDGRGAAGNMLISEHKRPVLLAGKTLVVMCGLDSDIQSILDILVPTLHHTARSTPGAISCPASVERLLSTHLYAQRAAPLYCEAIIAGVDESGDELRPYVSSMDQLGAASAPTSFAVAGTASMSLFGICEAHYRCGLSQHELLRTVRRCFRAAVERDCLSGSVMYAYILTREGVFFQQWDTSGA